MTPILVQALVHGVVVTVSVFMFWTFIGPMRRTPVSARAGGAVLAGAVSAVITVAVTSAIMANSA